MLVLYKIQATSGKRQAASCQLPTLTQLTVPNAGCEESKPQSVRSLRSGIIGVLVNSSPRAYSAFERLAYSTAYALPLPGELGDEPLLRIFGNRLFFFLGLGRGGSFEP
jgi:hypothetical protein